MKNLLILGFVAAALIGCSKSNGGSCDSNAQLMIQQETVSDAGQLQSNNILVMPANAEEYSRNSVNSIRLDGKIYEVETSTKPENEYDPEATETLINFNTKMMIDPFVGSVSFSKNENKSLLKGKPVYDLNSVQLKQLMLKSMNDGNSEDFTVCSIDSVNASYAYSMGDETIDFDMSATLSVEYSTEMIQDLRKTFKNGLN